MDELTRAPEAGVAAGPGGFAREPQPGMAAIAAAATAAAIVTGMRDLDIGTRLPPGG
jgi:hypothetical protein